VRVLLKAHFIQTVQPWLGSSCRTCSHTASTLVCSQRACFISTHGISACLSWFAAGIGRQLHQGHYGYILYLDRMGCPYSHMARHLGKVCVLLDKAAACSTKQHLFPCATRCWEQQPCRDYQEFVPAAWGNIYVEDVQCKYLARA